VSPSVPATRAAEPSVEPTAAVALAATTLAAQNDLFQEAMGYKRQGSAGLAVTRLERLIAEYPASPLRESATVERMKLLDGMDHPAGRRAAQEYLGQWPGGFAVADAQRILARP
jgi:outer membrane protein assembly factor BamD (BamD/ComL family)